MKTITKAEVVAARQRVTDTDKACEQHHSKDLSGLSNEQMVDVELESIHLATQRDLALKEYQDLLHRFYHQERAEAGKERPAAKDKPTTPSEIVVEEYEQGRKRDTN